MRLRRVVQGVGLRHPQGQRALVHQPDEFGEPRSVGAHLDRAGPDPAHRSRLGVRDDADVGAPVPHPLQRRRAQDRLRHAKSDLLLLAPGPINRGVELTPDVADGPHSAILAQVANGLAVRMAVLYLVSGQKKP